MTVTKPAMAEKLQAELEAQKLATQKLEEEVAQAKLLNELELQKQEQEAWKAALDRLKQAKEQQAKRHAERLLALQEVELPKQEDNPQLAWIKNKFAEIQGHKPSEEELRQTNSQLDSTKAALNDIITQQQSLAQKASQLTKDNQFLTPEIQALLSATKMKEANSTELTTSNTITTTEATPDTDQNSLMEQLRRALAPKKPAATGDWQKDVLRQFLVNSNKTGGPGGTTTLKPDLLKKLTNEEDEFSMAEWLASLNRNDAGEWECGEVDECKHRNVRSGILDRATANIVQKETWPQKNLLEDWADEDIDFKQLQFEHLVAGELRTIELCTEPAQILGRLRLLRRISYAKLRGYEWPLIRKMYSAILRSIEAKEYTWADNFDRFETILYRRTAQAHKDNLRGGNRSDRSDREAQKKWFCRDWNKSEGCQKQSPHKAWFGTGANAVSRMVQHICAACYMKDRASREHPETHDSCPHRNA